MIAPGSTMYPTLGLNPEVHNRPQVQLRKCLPVQRQNMLLDDHGSDH